MASEGWSHVHDDGVTYNHPYDMVCTLGPAPAEVSMGLPQAQTEETSGCPHSV